MLESNSIDPALQPIQVETTDPEQSSKFDYMYVQQQYGNILEPCDDSMLFLELYQEGNSEDVQYLPNEIMNETVSETFAEDLKKLCQEKVKPLEEESFIRLKIRRNTIWQDIKLKLERLKDISKNGLVKVHFVAEAAVDEGGPKCYTKK